MSEEETSEEGTAPVGTVLVIDDTPMNLDLLGDVLSGAGYRVLLKKDGASGIKLAAKRRPDIVLLDIMMPELDGYETCRLLKQDPITASIPVIFMSALAETVDKVKGFAAGGVDYITKPFQVDEVRARVETHLRLQRLHLALGERNADLERELRVARELMEQARDRLSGAMVGESEAVVRLRTAVALLADQRRVLLLGDGGTGEEEVARALHHASRRRGAPFIRVDCARFQEQDQALIFGGDEPGKWQLAGQGTVFLDLLDALPRGLQGRVASQLQGADPPAVIVHSRSNLAGYFDPMAAIEPALYGGWSTIDMPRLSQRTRDIPRLAHDILVRRARRLGRTFSGLSEDSLARLCAYDWPGNLDELSSVLECALLASWGDEVVVDERLLEGGRRIGSYELTELIGRGGMGEVWRARHRLLVQPAAVKLVTASNPSADPAERRVSQQRFEREARATAMLRSQNTVRLYDYGVAPDGTLYYVMELLCGLDLKQLIERHGAQPAERAVALLEQACGSLAEAHAAGLVHRDLKPANIVVCRLGLDTDVVKVLDFGLVRKTSGTESEITQEGAFLGTPAFSPPEACLGEEVDHRSDIYALGGILYWLVTGKYVFERKASAAMLVAQIYDAPEPPSKVAAQPLSAAFDELVLACLEKDPDDRPSSTVALRERLRALRFDHPWTAARADEWWREHGPRTEPLAPPASAVSSDTTSDTTRFVQ